MPPRDCDESGRLYCTDCEGDGTVEACLGHPNDSDAPYEMTVCPTCDGSRFRACVVCGDEARVIGSTGLPYCGIECAEEDDAVPSPDTGSLEEARF